jgi:hypothetical protein
MKTRGILVTSTEAQINPPVRGRKVPSKTVMARAWEPIVSEET